MSRRRALYFLTGALAGLTANALGSRVTRAAEPTQSVVRLGAVWPVPSAATPGTSALWERLRELGYVKGQNLVVEERWADGRLDQLPALTADVLGHKIDVLITSGTPAAIAAKNGTSTVPIVAVVMGDPIGSALATSLARPGGNLTGFSLGWAGGMAAKWLELLQETVPRLSTVAVIEDPDNPFIRDVAKELEAIAPTRGLKLRFIDVRGHAALDRAFEQAARTAQALLVFPDSVVMAHRNEIIVLAAKRRLPAMYGVRDFVEAGGLMAYTPDFAVLFRRAGDYVDKILRGAKPGDLPIEQPTRYALIVNLKTAKALGLTVPESILLRADEVIR